ncbi:MAG: hypothetical protein ACREMY_25200, partial [bacterium]
MTRYPLFIRLAILLLVVSVRPLLGDGGCFPPEPFRSDIQLVKGGSSIVRIRLINGAGSVVNI